MRTAILTCLFLGTNLSKLNLNFFDLSNFSTVLLQHALRFVSILF